MTAWIGWTAVASTMSFYVGHRFGVGDERRRIARLSRAGVEQMLARYRR